MAGSCPTTLYFQYTRKLLAVVLSRYMKRDFRLHGPMAMACGFAPRQRAVELLEFDIWLLGFDPTFCPRALRRWLLANGCGGGCVERGICRGKRIHVSLKAYT